MQKISTEQVAEVVGLNSATLSRYIKSGKITAPKETMVGRIRMRLWSDSDIRRLKEILPTIANGRKTRYKKKHSVASSRQSAKAKKKSQARAPALHKKNKNK